MTQPVSGRQCAFQSDRKEDGPNPRRSVWGIIQLIPNLLTNLCTTSNIYKLQLGGVSDCDTALKARTWNQVHRADKLTDTQTQQSCDTISFKQSWAWWVFFSSQWKREKQQLFCKHSQHSKHQNASPLWHLKWSWRSGMRINFCWSIVFPQSPSWTVTKLCIHQQAVCSFAN